jgi:hypothetical protein
MRKPLPRLKHEAVVPRVDHALGTVMSLFVFGRAPEKNGTATAPTTFEQALLEPT